MCPGKLHYIYWREGKRAFSHHCDYATAGKPTHRLLRVVPEGKKDCEEAGDDSIISLSDVPHSMAYSKSLTFSMENSPDTVQNLWVFSVIIVTDGLLMLQQQFPSTDITLMALFG